MASATPLPQSFSLRAAALLAIGSLAFFSVPLHSAPSAPRVVDFRYGIPTWHQPLGVPEDWHKPMANERGALLYDFGPGPYVQGLTVVEASAEGDAFAFEHQDFLGNVRVPIMRSRLTRGTDHIEVTTLSVAPGKVSASIGRTKDYERLDGISGAIDWAKPGEGVSPEFRNTAWGITRPIHYRIKVSAGAAKRIMLGFCESYKSMLYQRTAHMDVEGAPAQIVDLALNAPHNLPQVFLFDAHDSDQDGWINIRVFAPQGQDPNATLATIAVYAPKTVLTRAELVAGSAAEKDRAELRIACGTEMSRQAPRTDLLHASYSGNLQPTILIKSLRTLTLDDDGVVHESGHPFVITHPKSTGLTRTETGWKLAFPDGTKEVTTRILSGDTGPKEVRAARGLSLAEAIKVTTARWSNYAIPYGRITVADPAIQRMIESSLRTLYQARETINGHTQFNSSFSLYRGLWAGDAVYATNLAAHLGDSKSGRQTLDALFSHQLPNGIIDELHPQQIFRTTVEVIWGVERDAQISNDWSYAKQKWPQIVLGVAGIRALRDQTLSHPDAPYYGMFPPGFSDGGILDIGAEYSSVYCAITGLHAAERIAQKLGHTKEAAEFRLLADEFHAAFEKNRKRDQRPDKNGNLYLPVRVGFKGEDPIPQLTQWAVMDSHLNGEGWLTSDHELVKGTLALLESVEKQGIPISLGWMPNGIWVGMGLMYAFQPLILDRPEKVSDILYAAANHASRVGTWVEEQSLITDPLKMAGDQPHNFTSTMMVHLPASMLAYERMSVVHLLGAVPSEWLTAGAVNRLDRYRTAAGTVTLALTVSADGKTATLNVEPISRSDKAIKIQLHTASLRAAGFEISSKDEAIELQPGQHFSQTFRRK
jgi:hypothetical protein